MPPWVDWLGYFGADAIGRVVGTWLRFCFSLPKLLLSRLKALSRNTPGRSSDAGYSAGTHSGVPGRFRSWVAKASRMVMATLVALTVWAIVSSRPVWTATGAEGDRILAGLLMLVSVTWVISVVRIFLSQPRKKRTPISSPR